MCDFSSTLIQPALAAALTWTEASLTVPYFTIYRDGSSCTLYSNCVFFSLILDIFHSFSVYWYPKGRMGCQVKDREGKEERIRPLKRELHELLYTKIVKSGTIRLTSDVFLCRRSEQLLPWLAGHFVAFLVMSGFLIYHIVDLIAVSTPATQVPFKSIQWEINVCIYILKNHSWYEGPDPVFIHEMLGGERPLNF